MRTPPIVQRDVDPAQPNGPGGRLKIVNTFGSTMKLSTRLTLAMVALVLLTTAVLGFLNYQTLVTLLTPRALDRLQSQARLSALLMDTSLRAVQADVRSAQASETLRSLMAVRLKHPPASELSAFEADWRRRVAIRFVAELSGKPSYAIQRIIGVEDGGIELVRVDRSGPGGAIRIVPPEELSRRGDRDYFKRGMAIADDQTFASDIGLMRTPLGPEYETVPTLRVASPFRQPDGTPFALFVINVDLRPAIAQLREGIPTDNKIYLVNEAGDYLAHPNPEQEFGFERGTRFRVQDDFPALAQGLYEQAAQPRIMEDRQGQRFAVAWHWAQLAGGPRVAVIETRPYAALLVVGGAVKNSTLLGGAAAALIAILMAVPLARSLTRPLVRITEAAEAFSRGESVRLASGGSREIAVLADAFIRMVSESHRKTAALSEEIEERSRLADVLNKTIGNMVDPVLVSDADGKIIIANEAARKTFGQVTAIGASDKSLKAERRQAGAISRLAPDQWPLMRAARGEVIENFEVIIRPKGTDARTYLIANGRPLRSEAGKLQGAVMVYHDVTETKKVEEALRQSEQMARAIIDTTLDAFVQIDSAGAITEWSPHAETMFGWPRDEVVGRRISGVIFSAENFSEGAGSYARFVAAIERGDPGYRVEFEATRRDGSAIQIEAAITALRHGDSFVTNAFMRDLTGKIISDEQLRQAQKMDSIGQLTGGIAHDFNNMLTVITGTIDILADAVADRPQLAAIAKLISEAADRGSEMTRLLLAFARKQPLQPYDTDINALVTGVQSLLRPTLGEQIEVETILQPGVWPVFVDRGQLESALVNLAVNARDAMPEGGKLTLETSNVTVDQELARRLGDVNTGSYVQIAVSDSGCGIPETIRDKVFDPFFTTKDVGKGTGLGLSMVYGFVKQSGGHVTLYSEEGFGTTFRIYLPRARAAGEKLAPAAAEAVPIGGDETILVVEDDEMVRNYVNAQLKGLGYTTVAVANAAAALAVSDRNVAFDLLFTDIVMPGKMNGVALAAEMVKRRPGLKVLFTSGYSENAMMNNNLPDSDFLLLSKPYRRTELARMIRLALTPGDPSEPEQKRA